MNRSIQIVRQLEQDFDPYLMIFQELKGKIIEAAPITMVLQRKEEIKEALNFFLFF